MNRPVKLIDLYIIKKFLGTYLFAIALILAITIMFDVNEKLDSFLKAPLKATIFDYFVNFLPICSKHKIQRGRYGKQN